MSFALKNEKELHDSCKTGEHDVVSYLLEAKTRATTFNNNGFPPLIVAASHGHSECVELLLQVGKGVTVDMPNRSGSDTALSIVCGAYRSSTPFVEDQNLP